MSDLTPHIQALRESLEVSPRNVPLRRHLASLLLESGALEAAEEEYRRALKIDPQDKDTMIGLATAFHRQGKNGLALVVLEEQLMARGEAPGRALVLYARVLLRSGRPGEAVAAYRRALADTPDVADAALAEELGMDAEKDSPVLEGRLRQTIEHAPEDVIEELQKPRVSFESVGGMESVKNEIRMKIILPLTNKDLFAAYGKKMGGGILLYGPPGCGKTHLARATAGEIRSGFISVGLHDVLDMWIGQSEQRLHAIFEQARRNTPCVLFFDEVDALGASRTDMRRSAGRQLINQFLSELDGVEANNEGVLILAATNAPWHLDSAFRRPGRFDRILFVPPPDEAAREAILNIHLHGKPTENLNLAKVAGRTEQFSGADLQAVVDLAVEDQLAQAIKLGKPIPLNTDSLLRAVKKVACSTAEWFASARNHALYANQGGIYDEILKYLKIKP